LVEGAGGLLVPIDSQHDMSHLALALGAPVLLVAADALGVLSHVLTAFEAATYRGVEIGALVLSQFGPRDRSVVSNFEILKSRLPCPAFVVGKCPDEDDALARAMQDCGLVDALFPE
jgi:dethiobiotin synthetase